MKEEKLITIFTSTYNRGYIIDNLFKSLLKQTYYNFEWLVIDDGSEDETEEYFLELSKNKLPFELRYLKKENGGKHTAANLALDFAKGELFFVVDSDDILTPKAIERILHHYNFIKDDDKFCGVCGLKGYFNGKVIGSDIDYEILNTTIIDYRFNRRIKGDKADVFLTKLLKDHRFPENDSERWCPLSIVWNRFGQYKEVRYFNEIIYLAEYLEDGISLNRNKTRRNSPKNTKQYYKELGDYNIPLIDKVKAWLNYWRFGLYSDESISQMIKDLGVMKSFISFIPGLALHYIDKRKDFLSPNKNILKNQSS